MITVTLDFNSVKLPVVIKKTTDKINEFGKCADREKCINYLDPIHITHKQISNILHVLCGCRPSPSYRDCLHKRLDFIDDVAKTALVKIDNETTYMTKGGELRYCSEFTDGKKIPYDSHASNAYRTVNKNDESIVGVLTWNVLYKRYGITKKEKYNRIISAFETTYGKTIEEIKEEFTFFDFLTELRKEKYDKEELINVLTEERCTPIIDVIQNNGKKLTAGGLTSNGGQNLATLCINTNPLKKVTINGKLVFNIDETNETQKKVYDAILNGTKSATMFDGGLVTLKESSIDDFYEDDFVSDGYKKVECV